MTTRPDANRDSLALAPGGIHSRKPVALADQPTLGQAFVRRPGSGAKGVGSGKLPNSNVEEGNGLTMRSNSVPQ